MIHAITKCKNLNKRKSYERNGEALDCTHDLVRLADLYCQMSATAFKIDIVHEHDC